MQPIPRRDRSHQLTLKSTPHSGLWHVKLTTGSTTAAVSSALQATQETLASAELAPVKHRSKNPEPDGSCMALSGCGPYGSQEGAAGGVRRVTIGA